MASHLSHVPFQTTRWSMVLDAGKSGHAESSRALAELCQIYWPPLYAYLRRNRMARSDAEDLVQGFFALLLARQDLAGVTPERGRFRSFLLASLKHFLANERDRANAQKRGGGQTVLSLDFEAAEGRLRFEPEDARTPEAAFERQWALTLLERVRAILQAEYATAGKDQLFMELQPYLTGADECASYAATAQRLGMTEAAVKMSVSRLRQKFRQRLRDEIAQTVATEAEIDQEVRLLIAALQGPS